MEARVPAEILDELDGPVVFCDCGHVIRYLNPAGAAKYAKRGGYNLVGVSIFDCHNAESNRVIREAFQAFEAGEDERFLCVSESSGLDVFMTAVRDANGTLLGYYERYE